jgi:hypothetical protein
MNRFYLILAGLLFSGLAGANSILVVTGVDSPLGYQQQIWLNEDGVNSQQYWIGGINITVDGVARVAWCIDLFTDISFNTYNTTPSWADTATLRREAWLVQNVVPTTQLQGAALQLALWDIAHDGGNGFAPGAGRITQSTDAAHLTQANLLNLANTYLAQSLGMSYSYEVIYHNTDVNGVPVQTLISRFVNDGGPLSQVPEPADAALVIGGLAMIAVGANRHARRRHRKSTSTT